MAVIGREEKDYGLIEDKDFKVITLDEQERKLLRNDFTKGVVNGKSQRKWAFPRCIFLGWNGE